MQSYIPDDDNGRVLQLLRARGDVLDKPRIIDYCFAFATRLQALEFAASVGEIDYEVCISYYEEKLMWQTVVKKFMIPDHTEITRIEADLTARAEVAGGI